MRFRLKTEFLTYAHDQIRGGLWYKPTWWEAVQKVPPTAVMPRIKKKDIPRIRFVEDKLMGEFTARNPMLRTVDARNFARGRPQSVASEFVAEQLRHMRADKGEGASFDAASRWLVENGASVLGKVDPKLAGDDGAPEGSKPPADLFARALGLQEEMMRSVLKAEARARMGDRHRALPPHRTFASAEEIAAVATRGGARREPQWPQRALDDLAAGEESNGSGNGHSGSGSGVGAGAGAAAGSASRGNGRGSRAGAASAERDEDLDIAAEAVEAADRAAEAGIGARSAAASAAAAAGLPTSSGAAGRSSDPVADAALAAEERPSTEASLAAEEGRLGDDGTSAADAGGAGGAAGDKKLR